MVTTLWYNAGMNALFLRNEMYWGEKIQSKLKDKHVFIFGLGGVGGYAADALARAGIGKLTLVDFDEVSTSNVNRQLVALNSTIGQKKTTLFKDRLRDINPDIELRIFDEFYDENKNEKFFDERPDCVIDAIDTQRAKVALLVYCSENSIPVFSSMGAGNRVDPTKLFIADISEYDGPKCSFVNNLKYNLIKHGVEQGITCVFSREKPKKPLNKAIDVLQTEDTLIKKISPSSTPFVPPVAGYYLAFGVVSTIIENIDKK